MAGVGSTVGAGTTPAGAQTAGAGTSAAGVTLTTVGANPTSAGVGAGAAQAMLDAGTSSAGPTASAGIGELSRQQRWVLSSGQPADSSLQERSPRWCYRRSQQCSCAQ
ncbi:hypothetical protein WJX75_008914 [Coccomyxa subellipsoidea]|uniref:Uncharacterized protein n=1 Tax=Coccomyxa subellipsoidea TaxID=248742 RepID=A0ABR2YLI1_9CHLO